MIKIVSIFLIQMTKKKKTKKQNISLGLDNFKIPKFISLNDTKKKRLVVFIAISKNKEN